MTRITVIGGTGYAGGHIVREAAARGHAVTVVARTAPAEPIAGVSYVGADVLDADVLQRAVDSADVVVEALSPRGELAGRLVGVVDDLASLAQRACVRLAVVGGAGSLLVGPDGPTVADTPDFPEAFQAEAAEMATILADLRASDPALDWFFLSPAAGFGPWAEGEATGVYRLGGDSLLVDSEGNSTISGADYAHAFLDEIEHPAHSRERFSIAY